MATLVHINEKDQKIIAMTMAEYNLIDLYKVILSLLAINGYSEPTN
jgi:hypothetical protein